MASDDHVVVVDDDRREKAVPLHAGGDRANLLQAVIFGVVGIGVQQADRDDGAVRVLDFGNI